MHSSTLRSKTMPSPRQEGILKPAMRVAVMPATSKTKMKTNKEMKTKLKAIVSHSSQTMMSNRELSWSQRKIPPQTHAETPRAPEVKTAGVLEDELDGEVTGVAEGETTTEPNSEVTVVLEGESDDEATGVTEVWSTH
jgi:hypothetical protein